MGRKRKKVVRVPRRRLPKFYSCPRCGRQTIMVEILRDREMAVVSCSNCNVREEFNIKSAQSAVDVYCMFTDKAYSDSAQQVTSGDLH